MIKHVHFTINNFSFLPPRKVQSYYCQKLKVLMVSILESKYLKVSFETKNEFQIFFYFCPSFKKVLKCGRNRRCRHKKTTLMLRCDRLKKRQKKINDYWWWKIQKLFYFFTCIFLMRWLMRPSKNFEKGAILHVSEMVSFWGGNMHFGKTPLKLCIFRHDFFCSLSIWLSISFCSYKM